MDETATLTSLNMRREIICKKSVTKVDAEEFIEERVAISLYSPTRLAVGFGKNLFAYCALLAQSANSPHKTVVPPFSPGDRVPKFGPSQECPVWCKWVLACILYHITLAVQIFLSSFRHDSLRIFSSKLSPRG